MYIGTYVGYSSRLRGQHALLRRHVTDSKKVVAQFDEPWTGLSYGWWAFDELDFLRDRS